MIIIDDIAQQSPEWFKLRAGVPSASNFKKIITSKGEPSKSQADYIYELAGEKVIGTKEETYQSFDMLKGVEREAEARRFYELVSGESVQQVAFVFMDESRAVGCSPDSLLRQKKQGQPCMQPSGLEIMCPKLKTHTRHLIDKELPYEKFQQVQGSMWVCGFNTWLFMSYYPGLPPFILEVERDYKFTNKLEGEMESFLQELETVYSKLKGV